MEIGYGKFLKCTTRIFCALCIFVVVGQILAREKTTLNLDSGEVLIGEIVERDDDIIEIKNTFTTIKLPASKVVSESVEIIDEADDSEKVMPTVQLDNVSPSEEWHPLFGSEKSLIGKNDPVGRAVKGWMDDYTHTVMENMPENFSMNFRFGVTSKTTTYREDSVYFYASLNKDWETMSFNLSGFYDYVWQKSNLGVENVTTDKYGATADYKWNFLDKDSNWYFTAVSTYRHDTIKMINYQFDESVGLGYEFKFPTLGLKWSVSLGPGMRYLDAVNFDRHVIPMTFLKETMTWDITELLRMEHQGYFGMDLANASDGTAYVMVGLVFAPENVVSLAFRMINDYDNINSSQAIKNEQKIIFSVEIPIRGPTSLSDK